MKEKVGLGRTRWVFLYLFGDLHLPLGFACYCIGLGVFHCEAVLCYCMVVFCYGDANP